MTSSWRRNSEAGSSRTGPGTAIPALLTRPARVVPRRAARTSAALGSKMTVQESPWLNSLLITFNVKKKPFDDARVRRALSLAVDRWKAAEVLPKSTIMRYVGAYVKLYGDFWKPKADLPVVYTPLCGVGQGSAGDVLNAIGFPIKSPPQEAADGSFAVIPFRSPNPEVIQST